jgi:dolichol-phosphate mannosyltransferase
MDANTGGEVIMAQTTSSGISDAAVSIRSASRPRIRQVSVVVPTRNEIGNVRPLLDRLAAHPADVIGEVLFVDDSDDETPAVIEFEAAGRPFPVRVLHRQADRRVNGLSGAVIEGLEQSHGDWVCVMDGDLQHPPEVIAQLIAEGEDAGATLMCATRYRAGGDNRGLALGRSFVSRASTQAAQLMFPRALAGVTDPMSGFFLVRRTAVRTDRLRPRGFKILLEIMVREPTLRTVEVPYTFEDRAWGDTKASLRQGVQYVAHLGTLRMSTAREHLRTRRSPNTPRTPSGSPHQTTPDRGGERAAPTESGSLDDLADVLDLTQGSDSRPALKGSVDTAQ